MGLGNRDWHFGMKLRFGIRDLNWGLWIEDCGVWIWDWGLGLGLGIMIGIIIEDWGLGIGIGNLDQ